MTTYIFLVISVFYIFENNAYREIESPTLNTLNSISIRNLDTSPEDTIEISPRPFDLCKVEIFNKIVDKNPHFKVFNFFNNNEIHEKALNINEQWAGVDYDSSRESFNKNKLSICATNCLELTKAKQLTNLFLKKNYKGETPLHILFKTYQFSTDYSFFSEISVYNNNGTGYESPKTRVYPQIEPIKKLIDHLGNKSLLNDIKDNKGNSAFSMFFKNPSIYYLKSQLIPEVLFYIFTPKEINFEAKNKKGNTPRHTFELYCYKNNSDPSDLNSKLFYLREIMNLKAPIDLTNNNGESPRYYAFNKVHPLSKRNIAKKIIAAAPSKDIYTFNKKKYFFKDFEDLSDVEKERLFKTFITDGDTRRATFDPETCVLAKNPHWLLIRVLKETKEYVDQRSEPINKFSQQLSIVIDKLSNRNILTDEDKNNFKKAAEEFQKSRRKK